MEDYTDVVVERKQTVFSISFFSLPRCLLIIITLDYIMAPPVQWKQGGTKPVTSTSQSIDPGGLNPECVWKYHSLCPSGCFIHSNSVESQALFKGASLELKQYWLHMVR